MSLNIIRSLSEMPKLERPTWLSGINSSQKAAAKMESMGVKEAWWLKPADRLYWNLTEARKDE